MTEPVVRDVVLEALHKVTRVRGDLAPQLQNPDFDLPIAELNIDSLEAIEWCMEIEIRTGTELDPAELASASSISELIRMVAGRGPGSGRAAETTAFRARGDGPAPLSFVQEQMWDHCQTPEVVPAYLLCAKEQIDGPLDATLLRDCLSDIVRRHEILRTTFGVVDGRPVQTIHPVEPVALPLFDLRTEANQEAAADRIIAAEQAMIGDPARGPLIRFVLFRIRDDAHWLARICHHLLWDSRSATLLLDDLSAQYEARRNGTGAAAFEKRMQYADYAAWQRHELRPDGPAYRETVAWWSERSRRSQFVSHLPFLRPSRLVGVDPAAGTIVMPVDARLAERLDRLRRHYGATVYQFWLAAFAAMLAIDIGNPDVVVGTYMTNRRRPELRTAIGNFANTLALRFQYERHGRFGEWLEQVRRNTSAAEARGEIPYEMLRAILQASGISPPEIRAIFTAPGGHGRSSWQCADITMTRVGNSGAATMPWGFSFTLDEGNGAYTCMAQFDAEEYDPAGVRSFMQRLLLLLEMILRQPDMSMGELWTRLRRKEAAMGGVSVDPEKAALDARL